MSDSRTLKPAIDDLVTRGIAPSDAATAAKLSEELGRGSSRGDEEAH